MSYYGGLRPANPIAAGIQAYKDVDGIFETHRQRKIADEDRQRQMQRQQVLDQRADEVFVRQKEGWSREDLRYNEEQEGNRANGISAKGLALYAQAGRDPVKFAELAQQDQGFMADIEWLAGKSQAKELLNGYALAGLTRDAGQDFFASGGARGGNELIAAQNAMLTRGGTGRSDLTETKKTYGLPMQLPNGKWGRMIKVSGKDKDGKIVEYDAPATRGESGDLNDVLEQFTQEDADNRLSVMQTISMLALAKQAKTNPEALKALQAIDADHRSRQMQGIAQAAAQNAYNPKATDVENLANMRAYMQKAAQRSGVQYDPALADAEIKTVQGYADQTRKAGLDERRVKVAEREATTKAAGGGGELPAEAKLINYYMQVHGMTAAQARGEAKRAKDNPNKWTADHFANLLKLENERFLQEGEQRRTADQLRKQALDDAKFFFGATDDPATDQVHTQPGRIPQGQPGMGMAPPPGIQPGRNAQPPSKQGAMQAQSDGKTVTVNGKSYQISNGIVVIDGKKYRVGQ